MIYNVAPAFGHVGTDGAWHPGEGGPDACDRCNAGEIIDMSIEEMRAQGWRIESNGDLREYLRMGMLDLVVPGPRNYAQWQHWKETGIVLVPEKWDGDPTEWRAWRASQGRPV